MYYTDELKKEEKLLYTVTRYGPRASFSKPEFRCQLESHDKQHSGVSKRWGLATLSK